MEPGGDKLFGIVGFRSAAPDRLAATMMIRRCKPFLRAAIAKLAPHTTPRLAHSLPRIPGGWRGRAVLRAARRTPRISWQRQTSARRRFLCRRLSRPAPRADPRLDQ